MSKLKHYISKYLDENRMLQKDFAQVIGVQPNTLSQWLSDKREPDNGTLVKISQVINVPVDLLLGGDVLPPNIHLVHLRKFRVLGNIACGEPVFADEDFETYVCASSELDADSICFNCAGDSMIGAGINNGDIVFIKPMDIVPNGEIAAVLIEDEATLKVWQYQRDKNRLVLLPANPAYEPLIYEGEELNHIRCLGMAVYIQRRIGRRAVANER